MVINRKHMARAKVEQLKQGVSAFAESTEVVHLMEKEISKQNLNVLIDRTPMGAWFIPVK